MAREPFSGVGALEKPGEGCLRTVEAGGEAQRLSDGRMARREGLRAGGATFEVGGDAQWLRASARGALRP